MPHPPEISDKKAFTKFLSQLHTDYLHNGQHWENKTLESFLEAMISYSEDIQGYYHNTNQNVNADEASWKVFADILKGASVYE